jgi:uncharacterized protein with von Willebrand factor type A (vWA) domain
MELEKLEEEFDRFIEFGGLLDRKMRRYLVQYLKQKAGMEEEMPPLLQETYYRYFRNALEELFDQQNLLELIRRREAVSRQVMADTLQWIRKASRDAQRVNPFEKESSRLSQWSITPLARWVTNWHIPLNFIRQNYRREQLDPDFYAQKFKQTLQEKPLEALDKEERERLEMLIKDFLAQWDALLSARLLEFQLKKLNESKEDFQDLLNAKVEEYNKLSSLIQPFAEYAGRYWDLSRELWQDSSFDVLERYQELLEDEESIRKLADKLGKMREAEIEIEEETYERVIVRKQWLEDMDAKSEIDGVRESNDLSALISSEVGLLADQDTETVFLQKFADQNLLTFRYLDRQLVTSEHEFTETDQVVKQKEKGPFIVCVDTSDSMTGEPEQIAKVLCFAILKMAAAENRRAYLINFSVGIKTIDLYDIANSIEQLAEFLQMSFRGSTDISPALYEVLRQLRGENYRDADVLVISDFIMYRLEEEITRGIRHFQQNKGTQFHSLTLSEKPFEQVLDLFDTNWLYNPRQKGIFQDLARGIHEIGERKV